MYIQCNSSIILEPISCHVASLCSSGVRQGECSPCLMWYAAPWGAMWARRVGAMREPVTGVVGVPREGVVIADASRKGHPG